MELIQKTMPNISTKRGNERINFDRKLDKLFDTMKCKFKKRSNAGCDIKAHAVNVSCKCLRKIKVRFYIFSRFSTIRW